MTSVDDCVVYKFENADGVRYFTRCSDAGVTTASTQPVSPSQEHGRAQDGSYCHQWGCEMSAKTMAWSVVRADGTPEFFEYVKLDEAQRYIAKHAKSGLQLKPLPAVAWVVTLPDDRLELGGQIYVDYTKARDCIENRCILGCYLTPLGVIEDEHAKLRYHVWMAPAGDILSELTIRVPVQAASKREARARRACTFRATMFATSRRVDT